MQLLKQLSYLFFLYFFIILSCTKFSSTTVGGNTIPNGDGLGVYDTILPVYTQTLQDPNDSIYIFVTDNQILGNIQNDPIFGQTKARILFEPKPPFFAYYFSAPKDSIILDSCRLLLSYVKNYGDSTTPITLGVSQIAPSTPLMLTNYPVQYPQNFTTITIDGFTPQAYDIRRLSDSVINRFERTTNQIRIAMPLSFGKTFVNAYDSNTAYKSAAIFRQYFAGLEVSATSGNALLSISLSNQTNTNIAFYYHYSYNGVKDTTASYFPLTLVNDATSTVQSRFANFITRNYTGSFQPNLNTNRPFDSINYIQTSPGTFVSIAMPEIVNFPNVIINRADLTILQIPNNPIIDGYFSTPTNLLLAAYDSTRYVARNVPNDFVVDATGTPNYGYFGGNSLQTNVPNYGNVYSYQFNLTRYIQGIVTRKNTPLPLRLYAVSNALLWYQAPYPNTQYPLFDASGNPIRVTLTPTYENTTAFGRAVIGGGDISSAKKNNSPFRMFLRISYTVPNPN